jgi:ATP-dependent DNA helicase RecG
VDGVDGVGGPLSGESAALPGESGPLSGESDGLSRDPRALSMESTGLSRESPAASADDSARRTLLEPLPGDLAARLGGLGRRSHPETVREVVLDLLRHREWRLDELAMVLRRNPEYLRQHYVQPLVRAGRATMSRPEEPNDPQQAYRAVETTS